MVTGPAYFTGSGTDQRGGGEDENSKEEAEKESGCECILGKGLKWLHGWRRRGGIKTGKEGDVVM